MRCGWFCGCLFVCVSDLGWGSSGVVNMRSKGMVFAEAKGLRWRWKGVIYKIHSYMDSLQSKICVFLYFSFKPNLDVIDPETHIPTHPEKIKMILYRNVVLSVMPGLKISNAFVWKRQYGWIGGGVLDVVCLAHFVKAMDFSRAMCRVVIVLVALKMSLEDLRHSYFDQWGSTYSNPFENMYLDVLRSNVIS